MPAAGIACSGLGDLEHSAVGTPIGPKMRRADEVAVIVGDQAGVGVRPFALSELRTLKRVRAGTAGTTEGPGHFAMVPRQI